MTPTPTQRRLLEAMFANDGTLATDAMRHMGVRGPTLAQVYRRGWVYAPEVGLWSLTAAGLALVSPPVDAERLPAWVELDDLPVLDEETAPWPPREDCTQ